MTHKPERTHHHPKSFAMPALSDEAVIQIQDFLHLVVDAFEDHDGHQIERFYRSNGQHSPELDLGEPPN
jgi:hypothetical protein